MNGRGLLIVNMVLGKDKENVSPNEPSHDGELDPVIKTAEEASSFSTEQWNRETNVISPYSQNPGPSFSEVQLMEKKNQVDDSPYQSDKSEFDDSDADPDFVYPAETRSSKVFVASSSSSSSSSSTDSSSSSSSCSSETEDENIAHQDSELINIEVRNPTVAENNEQKPTTEERKGKKRLRKPSTWKTKVAKIQRNSGKAYQSLSKSKKHIQQRNLRPPCGTKCRLKCTSSIDEASRQKLFNAYWELADLQRQREFIVRHSQVIKPKYRYSSTQNLRALNTAFYFEIEGSKVRVCKEFFKSTLDLNDRVIKTALSKKLDSGVIEGDLRGKHGNQPTIDPQVKKSVMDFINSIPRVESHYLRAQTTREFIFSDRCLADLYRDYKALRENSGLPFATASTFNRIFNSDFNISFFIPKKDQCELCQRYENSDEEGKRKLHQSYKQHLEEKDLVRKEKENDKNRTDGTIAAVYDLQAVMQVPKSQVSTFFYKSRINCLNFTISDLYAKEVICYFWDETEGARGAVEIGSCVLDYIRALLNQNPEKEIDIIFYSDNCCGQQKNKYLLSVYAYAIANLRVKSITHKFLISGHSQNEGDNVHSVIEKQIKRHLKSGPIFSPQTYSTLIRTAKKTGRPYKVVEMTHDKFYDIKVLQESWGNNFNTDEDKNQVKWHDIKILRVEKAHPESFFYKTSFADEIFRKTLVRKRRTTSQSIISVDLTRAYAGKIPLSDAKRKDIQELVDKQLIPVQYYESYYKNVLGQ